MGPNVFEFDQNKHVLEFAEHRHIIDTSFYNQCCYGHELLVPLKNCARRIWSPLRSIRPTFAPWHEMNETLQWWASPCYFVVYLHLLWYIYIYIYYLTVYYMYIYIMISYLPGWVYFNISSPWKHPFAVHHFEAPQVFYHQNQPQPIPLPQDHIAG